MKDEAKTLLESTSTASYKMLEVAAQRIDLAATAAQVLGHRDQATRLYRIVRAIEREAEYARNCALGLPTVSRRLDAPDGATIGWYFRFDAATRGARSALGLRSDYPLDDLRAVA